MKTKIEKLKIGLLIDTFIQPKWVYEIIENVSQSDIAEFVLVIINTAEQQSSLNFLRTLIEIRDYSLWNLYSKLDASRCSSDPNPFKPVDAYPLLRECYIINVKPIPIKHDTDFHKKDFVLIASYHLDVALRFGFRRLNGSALKIAKYGVWSFNHVDDLLDQGLPPGFWEIMENQSVIRNKLQIKMPDRVKVLFCSWNSTVRASWRRTLKNIYSIASPIVLRKLKDLYEDSLTGLNKDEKSTTYTHLSRIYPKPTNFQVIVFLGKMILRHVLSRFRVRFFDKTWFIGYNINGKGSYTTLPFNFKFILPPHDHRWADPFPIEKDGRYWIFIEEFILNNQKAHIAVIEMGYNGVWKKPKAVLEKDYHLSYPFIFTYDGNLFMIPETSKNKSIELYRCVDFPYKWELEKMIMRDIVAVDTTLAEIEGQWWMFTNIQDGVTEKNAGLYLFCANSPLGKWKPHKCNPVKLDVTSSRPAGNLFHYGGALYRPAQDCSVRYGYSTIINRILNINTDEFLECEAGKITPEWSEDIIASHTINRAGALTVIDAARYKAKFIK